MDFDQFFGELERVAAFGHMSQNGKNVLKGMLENGFKIRTTKQITVIANGKEARIIDSEGNVFEYKKIN